MARRFVRAATAAAVALVLFGCDGSGTVNTASTTSRATTPTTTTALTTTTAPTTTTGPRLGVTTTTRPPRCAGDDRALAQAIDTGERFIGAATAVQDRYGSEMRCFRGVQRPPAGNSALISFGPSVDALAETGIFAPSTDGSDAVAVFDWTYPFVVIHLMSGALKSVSPRTPENSSRQFVRLGMTDGTCALVVKSPGFDDFELNSAQTVRLIEEGNSVNATSVALTTVGDVMTFKLYGPGTLVAAVGFRDDKVFVDGDELTETTQQRVPCDEADWINFESRLIPS